MPTQPNPQADSRKFTTWFVYPLADGRFAVSNLIRVLSCKSERVANQVARIKNKDKAIV